MGCAVIDGYADDDNLFLRQHLVSYDSLIAQIWKWKINWEGLCAFALLQANVLQDLTLNGNGLG